MIRASKSTTSREVFREVFCALFSSPSALFITLIGFGGLALSCKQQDKTPSWNKEGQPTALIEEKADRSIPASQHSAANDATRVRFVAYNLRNYLTMRRGKELRPKPQHQIDDVINNLARAKPDVLGLCEIGNLDDLADLQLRLKRAGHELPHQYLTRGEDPVRSLALLSRYPIIPHPSALRKYTIGSEEFRVSRGFLDATVCTPVGKIRLLGAHLKSKRPVEYQDQAVIRRHEALILRQRATEILSAEEPPLLLVYGDMNDTRRSQSIRTIKGPYRGNNSLRPIELEASDGTKWTQYWAAEDVYSRFDFAFASARLLPKIDKEHSYVLDTPRGDQASDHRALIVIIK